MDAYACHSVTHKGKRGIALQPALFQQSGNRRFSQRLIAELIQLIPAVGGIIPPFFLIAL